MTVAGTGSERGFHSSAGLSAENPADVPGVFQVCCKHLHAAGILAKGQK